MSQDKELADFILPSNPVDRKDIVDSIYDIVGQMREIKDKRSFITDTKKRLKEQYKLSPKIISRYASVIQKQNFQDEVAEAEAFAETFEILFERGTPAPVNTPTSEDE